MVDVDRVGAVGMNSDLRKESGRCSVGSMQGFAFCKLRLDSASGIYFVYLIYELSSECEGAKFDVAQQLLLLVQ